VFNICPRCGEYSVEKTIDSSGPFAICPFCQYAHPFLQQPLFILTGASGAGKSAICLQLVPLLREECVVLEADILWGVIPATQENDYQDYRNIWLRVAKNVGHERDASL
jgi:adenylylsulfate kinase-like enzyme